MTRRTTRTLCTAVILAVTALLSTSCSEEEGRADSFAARYGMVGRGIALPVAVPPRLQIASLSDIDRVQSASFYSTNEPMVHVCSGDRATCAERNGFTDVLRSAKVEGVDVTMFLLPEEDGITRQLSQDLQRFWAEVPLTVDRPDWVDSH